MFSRFIALTIHGANASRHSSLFSGSIALRFNDSTIQRITGERFLSLVTRHPSLHLLSASPF